MDARDSEPLPSEQRPAQPPLPPYPPLPPLPRQAPHLWPPPPPPQAAPPPPHGQSGVQGGRSACPVDQVQPLVLAVGRPDAGHGARRRTDDLCAPAQRGDAPAAGLGGHEEPAYLARGRLRGDHGERRRRDHRLPSDSRPGRHHVRNSEPGLGGVRGARCEPRANPAAREQPVVVRARAGQRRSAGQHLGGRPAAGRDRPGRAVPDDADGARRRPLGQGHAAVRPGSRPSSRRSGARAGPRR